MCDPIDRLGREDLRGAQDLSKMITPPYPRANGAHKLWFIGAVGPENAPGRIIDDTGPRMTKGFANGPTLGLGFSKTAIQTAVTVTLYDNLDVEAIHMKVCGESADCAEGVPALPEKRSSILKGN